MCTIAPTYLLDLLERLRERHPGIELQITDAAAPALQERLIAGEIDMMFMNISDALPYIRSGKLKAIAVGSARRNAALPDVPALGETIPGFVSATFFGIVAAPGTAASPDVPACSCSPSIPACPLFVACGAI